MSDEVDRLNTTLKLCNLSSDKFNFSACVSSVCGFFVGENRPTIKIDPNSPVSGLANAGQKITVIGDTDHSNATANNFVKNNLDQFPNIKHVLYEYELPDLEELEAQYPELKQGRTIEDKIAITKELREHTLSKIEDETSVYMDENLGVSFRQAWDIVTLHYDAEINPLYELESYLEEHNILANPTIDARDHWERFQSDNAIGDPKEREEQAKSMAESIQQVKERGMQVHFFGKNPQQKYDEMGDALEQKKQKFKENNKEIARHQDGWFNEKRYFDNLDLNAQDRINLVDRVLAYGDKVFEFNQDIIDLQTKATSIRFSDAALEAEADRILALTNGEDAIVVEGTRHWNGLENEKDVNEYLDEKLRQEAYKNGTIDSFVSTKRIDVHVSKTAYEDDEKLFGKDQDPPDVIYFEAEDEYKITPKGQKSFEFSETVPAVELNVQGTHIQL